MSDARGYSYALVRENAAADQRMLGVRLGKVCITADIPASEVARHFGVARQSVYSWFVGRFQPRPELVDAINRFLAHHEAAAL